jgi:hypothetical protein
VNKTPDNDWDTRYEWRAVALLSIGFGLVGLDRFMIQPVFPVMMHVVVVGMALGIVVALAVKETAAIKVAK